MTHPIRRQGFTLIELLVVIAIIGILSAIVLASLNTARAKGIDASIESNLHTVSTQAAIDYDSYPNAYSASTVATLGTETTSYAVGTGSSGTAGVGPFDAGTAGDAVAETALNAVASVAGGGIQFGYSPTAYVVEAQLTATASTYWCIDSTGIAKPESAPLTAGDTSCH
jgi:prepilin-type N-terminal cleavage/methylation domain-containing protein